MQRKLTFTTPVKPIIIAESFEVPFFDDNVDLDSQTEPEIEMDNTVPEKSKVDLKSDSASLHNSSLTQTVSHCSRLSRVTMDMAVYKDILVGREGHNIFSSMDHDIHPTKWFYINNSNSVEGPLDSFEMDKLFKDLSFTEITKVRRKDEEDFFSVKRLVRKYYKSVQICKLENAHRASNLSGKIVRFRKGTMTSTKKFKPENLEISGRDERVTSTLSRPQLVFINKATNSSDDDGDQFVSRVRSQTMTN